MATLEEDIMEKLMPEEQNAGVYSERILDFPVWRLFRFRIVSRYMKLNHGICSYTANKHFNKIDFLKNLGKSFCAYCKLFVQFRYRVENIVYAFPRLQKVGDTFLDKFTDPVIAASNIKHSCIVFQRYRAGNHEFPRYHSSPVIKTDFIEVFSKFIGILCLPFIVLRYFFPVYRTYKKAIRVFQLQRKDLLKFYIWLSYFMGMYWVQWCLLKKLRPKRVYLVDREIFYPLIVACKKRDVVVYEMQHGVTFGYTMLYSIPYDVNIDPDYFLTFGSVWKGKQFPIPENKIINIGWAYKSMLKTFSVSVKYSDKSVLVISEPDISTQITHVICQLAIRYPEYNFHIRLHPQEKLDERHLFDIERISNVCVQDNTMESTLTLLSYDVIVGENSSVLYEALGLDKKIGRLCFGGLCPQSSTEFSIEGFSYIENEEDFAIFMENPLIKKLKENNAYSDFDVNTVNQLM